MPTTSEKKTIRVEKNPSAKKSPVPKKTPEAKKSPKRPPNVKDEEPQTSQDNTSKKYLVPPSYPNQVVYVKKHVRENELSKLNGLQGDLHNTRHLLECMDVSTLPDSGVRLIERLTAQDAAVRQQGDKVANMLVEPDMSTHMAERNLILDRLRDLLESLASRPAESAQCATPSALTSSLMPHQLHAVQWMLWRETQNPCGGILADDMGLGKTITMISLILIDKEGNIDQDDDDEDTPVKGSAKLSVGGTLIVCPASLVQQWAAEVTKHCRPYALVVCLHHGAARAKHPHRLSTNDLVITSYNILQRDKEKNGVLMRVRWRRIVLDEAHVVRNYKAATSVAVSSLKGRRRWALTGTPVQNKDLDLFAFMNFLRMTPFDDLNMWKKWIDNKYNGGQERLATIMRSILLRRTKGQLQEKGELACLPTQEEHQHTVTLTQQEMNVYQKVLVLSKTLFAQFLCQQVEKQADTHCFVPSQQDLSYHKMHEKMVALQGYKGAPTVESHEILVLLLRLRQVCCHCGLIGSMLDAEDKPKGREDLAPQDLMEDLNKLSLEESTSREKSTEDQEEDEKEPSGEGATVTKANRSVLSPNNPVFKLDKASSKISAVMQCLQDKVFSTNDEKAIVVSQWTSVLRLVEKELQRLNVRSVTLCGKVPVSQRASLVNAINEPTNSTRVMLLSLCAGGVGLNLCGANHLLLLDPHWNPQLERQAQDRIYRVGQKKPVHIYRFICVDTVEQSIRKLQEAKLELADNVLTGPRRTNASRLSIENLKMLFDMGKSNFSNRSIAYKSYKGKDKQRNE